MLKRIISILLSITALFSGLTVSNDSDAIRYRNLPYGIRAKRQILDLNIPKNIKGDANLMLYIHGGAWTSGSKDDYEPALDRMTNRGIVAAALNYRYSGWPNYASVYDILDDITAALETIKEKAAENGINLKGVMFNGGSAGAHLSLLYAYSRVDEAPVKPVAVLAQCPPTDFTDFSFYDGSIHEIDPEKWCIPKSEWCKYLTVMTGTIITQSNLEKKTDALYDISPMKYVNKNTVPTILAHGTKDTVVPYANSVNLEKKLTEYGVEHEFITFEGAWHDLQGCPEGSKALDKVYIEYINKYLAK